MGDMLEYHQLVLEMKYCKLCSKEFGTTIPCPKHKEMLADLALLKTRNILNKLEQSLN